MNVLWVCLYTATRSASVLIYTSVGVLVYSFLKVLVEPQK